MLAWGRSGCAGRAGDGALVGLVTGLAIGFGAGLAGLAGLATSGLRPGGAVGAGLTGLTGLAGFATISGLRLGGAEGGKGEGGGGGRETPAARRKSPDHLSHSKKSPHISNLSALPTS